jgi:hypothetical protein
MLPCLPSRSIGHAVGSTIQQASEVRKECCLSPCSCLPLLIRYDLIQATSFHRVNILRRAYVIIMQSPSYHLRIRADDGCTIKHSIHIGYNCRSCGCCLLSTFSKSFMLHYSLGMKGTPGAGVDRYRVEQTNLRHA